MSFGGSKVCNRLLHFDEFESFQMPKFFPAFFVFRSNFVFQVTMKKRGDPWPTSTTVWQEWLIGVIGKIKGQMQQPSAERTCHAFRQAHTKSAGPVLQNEVIVLNEAATEILKCCNKGQTSYNESNRQTRQLTHSKTADLFKVFKQV